MSQLSDSDNPVRQSLVLPQGLVPALLTPLILGVVMNEMTMGLKITDYKIL